MGLAFGIEGYVIELNLFLRHDRPQPPPPVALQRRLHDLQHEWGFQIMHLNLTTHMHLLLRSAVETIWYVLCIAIVLVLDTCVYIIYICKNKYTYI